MKYSWYLNVTKKIISQGYINLNRTLNIKLLEDDSANTDIFSYIFFLMGAALIGAFYKYFDDSNYKIIIVLLIVILILIRFIVMDKLSNAV